MRSLLSMAACGLVAGLIAFNAPARATEFGPASMGYSTSSSNVAYDLSAGTLQVLPGASFTYSGGNDAYFNNVNDSTPGSTFQFSGMIHFSTTPGVLVPVSLPDLIMITTPTSGTYDFSATSVGTESLSSSPVDGDQLTLYLEGTMGGGTDNETPSATDVVLNMTNMAGLGGTVSGSIFNPPSGDDPFATALTTAVPVPEPASWALLGVGLAGLAGLRRQGR